MAGILFSVFFVDGAKRIGACSVFSIHFIVQILQILVVVATARSSRPIGSGHDST